MKQSLTITKSGVTTWITPLSYDFLIVAYQTLLHLLEVGVLDVVVGAAVRGRALGTRTGVGATLRTGLWACLLTAGGTVHLS